MPMLRADSRLLAAGVLTFVSCSAVLGPICPLATVALVATREISDEGLCSVNK